MKKQILVAVLKYGIGLGLLAWVIWLNWSITYEGQEVGIKAALERPVHVLPLLVAGFLCLGCTLLTFVRWFVLVRAQDLPFSLTSALRLGMVGYYLNTFLPGSVGGDIIKAAFLAREQSRRTVAVATVLLDRVVGLCGLIWLVAVVGGAFWINGTLEDLARTTLSRAVFETIVLGSAAGLVGSLVFWLLLGVLADARAVVFASWLDRVPRIGHSLAELWRAVWLYRKRGRGILLTLGMSMLSHSGAVLVFYLSACVLFPTSELPALDTHFLLVPVGVTIQAGFPTPGGIGGSELAFGELYALLGFAASAGIMAALVFRGLAYAWGLIGYLVYLRMRTALQQVVPEPSGGPATCEPRHHAACEAELTMEN